MNWQNLTALAVCVINVGMVAAAPPTSFIFSDNRIAGEDRPRTLSLLITSCQYGIRVLSDEGRSRDRITALKTALAEELGTALDGHTLNILSYQIYFNNAAVAANSAAGVVGGVAGALLTKDSTHAKCSHEKTPEGWFEAAETTNGNTPFVIQIRAQFDEVLVETRSVYSPSILLRLPPTAFASRAKVNFADAVAAPEVDAAINKANLDLIKKLRVRL
ncbi:hypothetical protein [Sphingomonas sp. Root710]|uniref:hypothetical protein n=1 Tax=Sphingomonas sp. Root710 TaxID=1736594 RepID=UPI0012E3CDA8|nr:hypothetical protein [Sphingomonas sp. Root710]